jgi:hypothetical protein
MHQPLPDQSQPQTVAADKVTVFCDRPEMCNRMHHGSVTASGAEIA